MISCKKEKRRKIKTTPTGKPIRRIALFSSAHHCTSAAAGAGGGAVGGAAVAGKALTGAASGYC